MINLPPLQQHNKNLLPSRSFPSDALLVGSSLTKIVIFIGGLSLLSACETLVDHEPVAAEVNALLLVQPMPVDSTKLIANTDQLKSNELDLIKENQKKQPEFYSGSGVFVGHSHYDEDSADQPASVSPKETKGSLTLNFQETDIHEVVKVLLGDVLKKNYVIDPAVTGTVNIQTSSPFYRKDLLPILNDLLHMSAATLVESDNLIKIVPLSKAALSSLPPVVSNHMLSSSGGFHTQIVPLRYIGAEEINNILQPFLKDTIAQIYPQRNLIILSGAQTDINRLVETIHIFDVDWLKGMSLAMVPLNYAEANDIVHELDALFGQSSGSPISAIVRFVPLERLNAIIIVTQQPRYLSEMSHWIQRLDRSDGIDGQQLYVYPVQNKHAGELAVVLNSIFSDQNNSSPQYVRPELAPNLEPVQLESDPNNTNQQVGLDNQTVASTSTTPIVAGKGIVLPSANSIKIIADETNNSLVILASPSDYHMIESALHKLDVTPLQVLIEASIIEVTLTDELSYGLEWFFKNNTGISHKNGVASLDLGSAGLSAISPGFSYGIVDAAGAVRGVLNTLANESKVNVLSSPSLMVLDNHTATINIGDQVPILTSQSTSNVTNDARTINQVEYRDTGVLMTVTPRVNSSGLIIMDIIQEVTDVAATNSSGIDAPTFQRRSIESTISVNTDNTIVLGGLIRDNRSKSKSGIPGLHKMPFIGPLFGQTADNLRRTELVVLLTPRVIRNDQDAWEITNEFKQKLKDLRHNIDEI